MNTFIENKVFVIFFYALIGLVICLWPLFIKERFVIPSRFHFLESQPSSHQRILKLLFFFIAGLAVLLMTRQPVSSMVVASLGVISLFTSVLNRKFDINTFLVSFMALSVSITLPWWHRFDDLLFISETEISLFVVLTSLMIYLFHSKSDLKEVHFPVLWFLSFTVLAGILTFSVGILLEDSILLTSWHNWGAYIGPAQLLSQGAVIFRDFPAQYGLGPTTLIAALGGDDFWRGMYYISTFSTFFFSISIYLLSFSLTRKNIADHLAVFGICFACCYFWSGYPPNVGSPVASPSVSGLRFLPALLLTVYLFFVRDVGLSKRKVFIAHALWAFGALWSPESAFYVTFIWWPFYIFIRRSSGSFLMRAQTMARSLMSLFLLGIGLFSVFNVVYRLIYQTSPDLYGFFAYAINPPGPMPINPHGTILYLVFTFILGVFSLVRLWHIEGDSLSFRRGFLVQLLCYSTFSYFLGRSHDNNILNLLPFVLLVLLHGLSISYESIFSRASIVMLAVLIGWLPLFGWHSWNKAIVQGSILQFDLKLLLNSMSFSNPETALKINRSFSGNNQLTGSAKDLGDAIEFLRLHHGKAITVLDYNMNLVPSDSQSAWSAIHGPANFFYIPNNRRREFLSRTAAKIKLSGWLVVDKAYPAEAWLADFDSAYNRTHKLDFGTYFGIFFVPKIRSGDIYKPQEP